MMACDEGFQEVAQKLIQITADVNLRDEVIIKFAFLFVVLVKFRFSIFPG